MKEKGPKSKFLKVKCTDCGNIQTIFDRTNLKISCSVCGSTIALPRGGKADIKGEIIGRVDVDIE
ncbi:MAG: 30S ribosomal protein S27e [Candidatus Thermoplasmatota archaeon]|nr:30S ribosomal protein S27e [Candidatus Thermoplasmatota archaeon]